MNPEQLLNAVEVCIKERTPLDCKSYRICWHEGRLKCLPARAIKDDGNCFGTFSEEDIKKGLSIEQWGKVAKKITEFFEVHKHTALPESVTKLGVVKHVTTTGNTNNRRI
jgi:hypothetical protein